MNTKNWLHPDLLGEQVKENLSLKWKNRSNLRLEPFLHEHKTRGILEEIQKRPFHLRATSPGQFRFQYWQMTIPFHGEDETILGDFCRWFTKDFCEWTSSWTGRDLQINGDEQLLSTLYTKGCYLDPHNDFDGKRNVAYILGLTRQKWKYLDGGYLEFLSTSKDGYEVAERREPGWNSLDLFDVSLKRHLHQVSMLKEKHERRVFAGWLYQKNK